jgi:hypothetical protein
MPGKWKMRFVGFGGIDAMMMVVVVVGSVW